jgi:hypothetical protein
LGRSGAHRSLVPWTPLPRSDEPRGDDTKYRDIRISGCAYSAVRAQEWRSYEPSHSSDSLQAQPRPLWQFFVAWMQLLPHAFPAEQTRQHLSAGMHAAGVAGASRSCAATGATSLAGDGREKATMALTSATTDACLTNAEKTIVPCSPRPATLATLSASANHGYIDACRPATPTISASGGRRRRSASGALQVASKATGAVAMDGGVAREGGRAGVVRARTRG